MRSIEVATAHNIIFKYELAGVGLRMLAWLIDGMIISLFMTVGTSIFGWNTMLFYLFILFPFFFYHLVFEIFNRGQSPGKMVIKLRVVTLRGTTPSLNDFFTRWIFRMVDISMSLGTLAIINIIGSEKNQRIGDLIAQTSVISIKNSNPISLKNLELLNEKAQTVEYPGLRNYSDEDMLLLKHAISRFSEYKTDENKLIVKKIGQRIANDLDIKEKDISIKFLKSLLNEYVILTR